jgi:hypothetical protein
VLHAGSGSVGPLCVRAHGLTPSLERQGICPKIQGLIAMDETKLAVELGVLASATVVDLGGASSVFTSNFRHKFIRHGRLRL